MKFVSLSMWSLKRLPCLIFVTTWVFNVLISLLTLENFDHQSTPYNIFELGCRARMFNSFYLQNRNSNKDQFDCKDGIWAERKRLSGN